jgi:hypothetical protein
MNIYQNIPMRNRLPIVVPTNEQIKLYDQNVLMVIDAANKDFNRPTISSFISNHSFFIFMLVLIAIPIARSILSSGAISGFNSTANHDLPNSPTSVPQIPWPPASTAAPHTVPDQGQINTFPNLNGDFYLNCVSKSRVFYNRRYVNGRLHLNEQDNIK